MTKTDANSSAMYLFIDSTSCNVIFYLIIVDTLQSVKG